MADIRLISFYLGLKVEQNRQKKTIKLSQPVYIDKVFTKIYFNKAYPVNILIKEEIPLKQRAKADKKAFPVQKKQYQGMTGSLMFSIIETRSDIGFAISIASCFTKNPSCQHTKILKTILRYIKGLRK